jgi:hypothetical protein
MADAIKVEVRGAKELEKAIKRFPAEANKYMRQAGQEAADRVVLPTQGLRKYPPATSANAPPTPYYIRGRGTQYQTRNTGTSERLGTQWYTKPVDYGIEIGNRASYAKWVHSDEMQAGHIAPKGWRKLREATEEQMDKITKVYQAWVDKLIKAVGL